MWKSLLESLLCRFPELYVQQITARKIYDVNKVVFLHFIKPGDTVFDIGANMGYYSTFFSRLVRNNGRVFSFEPVSSTYQILESHVSREFYRSNIKLQNFALGNQTGETEIFMPDQVSGQASLKKQKSGCWSDAEKVETHSIQIEQLDNFVKENSISKIDFIKIDVEGAEMECIQGGRDSLQSLKPKLFLEVNDAWLQNFNTSSRGLIEALKGLGYINIYEFSESLKKFKPYTVNLEKTKGFCGDLLFSTKPL